MNNLQILSVQHSNIGDYRIFKTIPVKDKIKALSFSNSNMREAINLVGSKFPNLQYLITKNSSIDILYNATDSLLFLKYLDAQNNDIASSIKK